MRKELLDKMMSVSEEEKKILNGNQINKALYTNSCDFDVNSRNILSMGKYIAVRTHTRFADFPLHGHDYIEIMYVCSGSIIHLIDGKEIVMEAGDILFMNQHVRHGIKRAGLEDIGVNFIILPEFFDIPLVMMKNDKKNPLADFLIGTLKIDVQQPQYLHFKTKGNTAIENLMENIISSLIFEGKVDENINQFTMGLVFLHLLNSIEAIGEDSLQGSHDIMADTAIQYINTNYQQANLTELAQSMHQSMSNMSKIIKKSTGYTFQELLQRKRFQQAVVFLVDTKMSIAEIMNAVGYENSSYFYKKFREKYGISPREYRISNKHNKKLRV